MNIALLQVATGDIIEGPAVRVPFGNYRIMKTGDFAKCHMTINKEYTQEVNSKLILSNNSTIVITALKAKDLTICFVREQ